MTRDFPTIKELSNCYIIHVLNHYQNKTKAASALGIAYKTMFNKLDDMKANGLIEHDELSDTYFFKSQKPKKPKAEKEPTEKKVDINQLCNEIYKAKYGENEKMEN